MGLMMKTAKMPDFELRVWLCKHGWHGDYYHEDEFDTVCYTDPNGKLLAAVVVRSKYPLGILTFINEE